MRTTYSAGCIVIGPSNNILIVNQNNDSWSLPKGHIDPGEDAQAAAKRETNEEAGITQLEFIQELGTYTRPRLALGGGDDEAENKTITMFLCKTSQSELLPTDPGNPEARWLEVNEVVNYLTHPKDKLFYSNCLPVIKRYINDK